MKTIASLSLFVVLALSLSQSSSVRADEPVANKITWHRNLYDGFQKASAEKKLLVVLFTQKDCAWCEKLDQEVIDSKGFHSLAGRAVFVRAESEDEDEKGNYAQLKDELKIKRVPAFVSLDVNADRIVEVARIVGFFERDKYMGFVNELLTGPTTSLPAVSQK